MASHDILYSVHRDIITLVGPGCVSAYEIVSCNEAMTTRYHLRCDPFDITPKTSLFDLLTADAVFDQHDFSTCFHMLSRAPSRMFDQTIDPIAFRMASSILATRIPPSLTVSQDCDNGSIWVFGTSKADQRKAETYEELFGIMGSSQPAFAFHVVQPDGSSRCINGYPDWVALGLKYDAEHNHLTFWYDR